MRIETKCTKCGITIVTESDCMKPAKICSKCMGGGNNGKNNNIISNMRGVKCTQ